MSKRSIVCDFCSDGEPVLRLFATEGVSPIFTSQGITLHMESPDDWACCILCWEFIRKDQRIGLLNRSWKTLLKLEPGVKKMGHSKQVQVFNSIKKIQEIFWKAWTGLHEPIDNPRRRRRARR
jgi:hypothetical protein